MPVILLGIPGAGKTTLAHELMRLDEDINYISLGEASRKLDTDSPQRKELDKLFKLGYPGGAAELFLDIIEPHVDEAIRRTGGFLLDGLPKKQSEVAPLQEFLSSKNADAKLLISCEIDPIIAYGRTLNRKQRENDDDSPEIFLNRTKIYLRDAQTIKDGLMSESEMPLVQVLTDKHSPENASRATLLISGREKREFTKDGLYESIVNGDRDALARIYGYYFDDTLKSIDHAALLSSEVERSAVRTNVEIALLEQDPFLKDTPKTLERRAENYVATTLTSIQHMIDSLIEEATLRSAGVIERSIVYDIFNQQLELRALIKRIDDSLIKGNDFERLIADEISANVKELSYIETTLSRLALGDGVNIKIDARELMHIQPLLWNQLTSNRILFAPDYNYRHLSNAIPGAHHSLLPFTPNIRSMTANSMGNYVPFVEAVSAMSYQGFSSTFGFLHMNGQDRDGQAFGIEYPIMMYDRHLLSISSPKAIEALQLADTIYFNHDLWHNLIPVYSESFILHHPDAPISYGGRTHAYNKFGENLRSAKEDYEIGLFISHSKTQQELSDSSHELAEARDNAFLEILSKINDARNEMSASHDEDTVERVIDYIATRAISNLYHIYNEKAIREKFGSTIAGMGLRGRYIDATDLIELLYDQRMIDEEYLKEKMQSERPYLDNDTSRTALIHNKLLAAEVLKDIRYSSEGTGEPGSEYIMKRIVESGVIDDIRAHGQSWLDPIGNAIWFTMLSPQRRQLRGYAEKVHGGYRISHGETKLEDPREVVIRQKQALDADRFEYAQRVKTRTDNQKLGYELYSLLFDDGQALQKQARQQLDRLRRSSDTGQRLFAADAVNKIDILINELVGSTYASSVSEVEFLRSFAESLDAGHRQEFKQLSSALMSVVVRYEKLSRRALKYQSYSGVNYVAESQHLIDETMNIS